MDSMADSASLRSAFSQVRTEVGAQVAEGDELVVLESMKMEIPVEAPCAGRVTEIRVAPDTRVVEGDVLVVLEP